ncbi:unnamed protein product [Echinostoma caproni]|uniref:GATA-type domain-containing protein n=1 Tax=Echinostoma caproni TaxID=27848 RepID=A0A183A6C1_9TREM|nr:unnamed protein product [Echinostoma caproni]
MLTVPYEVPLCPTGTITPNPTGFYVPRIGSNPLQQLQAYSEQYMRQNGPTLFTGSVDSKIPCYLATNEQIRSYWNRATTHENTSSTATNPVSVTECDSPFHALSPGDMNSISTVADQYKSTVPYPHAHHPIPMSNYIHPMEYYSNARVTNPEEHVSKTERIQSVTCSQIDDQTRSAVHHQMADSNRSTSVLNEDPSDYFNKHSIRSDAKSVPREENHLRRLTATTSTASNSSSSSSSSASSSSSGSDELEMIFHSPKLEPNRDRLSEESEITKKPIISDEQKSEHNTTLDSLLQQGSVSRGTSQFDSAVDIRRSQLVAPNLEDRRKDYDTHKQYSAAAAVAAAYAYASKYVQTASHQHLHTSNVHTQLGSDVSNPVSDCVLNPFATPIRTSHFGFSGPQSASWSSRRVQSEPATTSSCSSAFASNQPPAHNENRFLDSSYDGNRVRPETCGFEAPFVSQSHPNKSESCHTFDRYVSPNERECVKCGKPATSVWQPDGTGHFLCEDCVGDRRTVPATYSATSPITIEQNSPSMSSPDRQARSQVSESNGTGLAGCSEMDYYQDVTGISKLHSGPNTCLTPSKEDLARANGFYSTDTGERTMRMNQSKIMVNRKTRKRPTSMRKDAIQTRKRKSKKRRDYSLALAAAAAAAASANSASALAVALQHQQQQHHKQNQQQQLQQQQHTPNSQMNTGAPSFANKSLRYNPFEGVVHEASRDYCTFNEQPYAIGSPGSMNSTRSMLDYHYQVRLSYQLQQRSGLPPLDIHSSLMDPFLCSATALRYRSRPDLSNPYESQSTPRNPVHSADVHSVFQDAYSSSSEPCVFGQERSRDGFMEPVNTNEMTYSEHARNNNTNQSNVVIQTTPVDEPPDSMRTESNLNYQGYSLNPMRSGTDHIR